MKKLHRKRVAFSIIELMLVLCIMVLLFSISIPKMSFVNRFLVENEVDKMFTAFSFLQQRAIASNQEQEIIFDPAQNSYFYDLGGGSYGSIPRLSSGLPRTVGYDLKTEPKFVTCKLPDAVKFGFLQGANGPPSSPGKPILSPITFKDIGSGMFKITFYTDGKVQPGTVYFIDKNKNFMMALTCPISQVSFIRKYKYNQGKWVCLK